MFLAEYRSKVTRRAYPGRVGCAHARYEEKSKKKKERGKKYRKKSNGKKKYVKKYRKKYGKVREKKYGRKVT
jgi:hypothetical protein